MSEISNHREERVKKLIALFHAILEKNDPVGAIKKSESLMERIIPSDIIFVVDELVRQNIPMQDLKTGINKFLNVLHKAIQSHPQKTFPQGSLFGMFLKKNEALDAQLKALRPLIKLLNTDPSDTETQNKVRESLEDLLKYDEYYKIKENILFPVLEAHWPNFRCLGVMWSFHDDIRHDLRSLITILKSGSPEIKTFNRLIGNVYFNMYAIKFREEAILYPYAAETIPPDLLDALLPEITGSKMPHESQRGNLPSDLIDLVTGQLSAEQVRLIFNHLPVDITYVDENNKVRYFSTPGKRIFPRSKAIIGRDVNNCHPPESVHVVEEIVESFRSGKEDQASFWINMKNEMILIQYFAVRDEKGHYRGVIEVSQEISGIKSLQGERRLLQWKD